jgi:transposase
MEITTVGIDLAKSIFQVHAVDPVGQGVVRKALRRAQVVPFFAKLPRCLVGMEACGAAHHWARELTKLGHDMRLMPPAYVKPYVKHGKPDANDAAAICEAVTRPSMRFVQMKATEQQAALALHRMRDLLVKQRTQLVNMIRGLLAELGIEMVRGLRHALELASRLSAGDAAELPPLAQRVDRAGRSDRRLADPSHAAGEGVAGLAPGQRAEETSELKTRQSAGTSGRTGFGLTRTLGLQSALLESGRSSAVQ